METPVVEAVLCPKSKVLVLSSVCDDCRHCAGTNMNDDVDSWDDHLFSLICRYGEV